MTRTVTIETWDPATGTYRVERIEYEALPGRNEPVRVEPDEG